MLANNLKYKKKQKKTPKRLILNNFKRIEYFMYNPQIQNIYL